MNGGILQDAQGQIYRPSPYLPIGFVIFLSNNTNPSVWFGGTWTRIAKGRAIVGADENDEDFTSVKKNIGEKKHTLTQAELPSHTHGSKSLVGTIRDMAQQDSNTNIWGDGICSQFQEGGWYGYGTSKAGSGTKVKDSITINATHEHSTVGSGQSHNNIQPSFTLYIWERIA